MSWFSVLSLGGWLTVVVTALLVRGRQLATFLGVLIGIY